MKKFNNLVLVECGIGGAIQGAQNGPELLYKSVFGQAEIFSRVCVGFESSTGLFSENAKYLPTINHYIKNVIDAMREYFSNVNINQERLFIIGGDHSTACGSISGMAKSLPDKKIGVVWIDAHADIHSPFTTPSGNVHGMPVAAFLGLDSQDMSVNILGDRVQAEWKRTIDMCSQSISPADVIYLGIRDLEEQEWSIIKQNSISYFLPEEIESNGASFIWSQVKKKLSHCDLLYVTFDIDCLDSEYVPGTGTPVSEGLSILTAHDLVCEVFNDDSVMAFELVEMNPLLDVNDVTLKNIKEVFKSVV